MGGLHFLWLWKAQPWCMWCNLYLGWMIPNSLICWDDQSFCKTLKIGYPYPKSTEASCSHLFTIKLSRNLVTSAQSFASQRERRSLNRAVSMPMAPQLWSSKPRCFMVIGGSKSDLPRERSWRVQRLTNNQLWLNGSTVTDLIQPQISSPEVTTRIILWWGSSGVWFMPCLRSGAESCCSSVRVAIECPSWAWKHWAWAKGGILVMMVMTVMSWLWQWEVAWRWWVGGYEECLW
jgi:hypothetical protein